MNFELYLIDIPMDNLLSIGVLIAVLVLLYAVFKYTGKVDKAREKELEMSLNDENLYDFETGGKIPAGEYGEHIYPDAYEDKIRDETEVLEYILRHLISGAEVVPDPELFVKALNGSSIKKRRPGMELNTLYKLKDDVYIGITSYEPLDDEADETDAQSFSVLGFYTAYPLAWSSTLENARIENTGTMILISKEAKMGVEEFLEFKAELMRV